MATKRMLVDASHPEETRIVVTSGNRLDEFDYEAANRRQLRGNIYLAKVTRVEPSLQAAFVEYGGNRHGFLAFSEIHPDYFQIPVADREKLLADVAQSVSQKADEEENGSETNAFGTGEQPLIAELEGKPDAEADAGLDAAAQAEGSAVDERKSETNDDQGEDSEEDGEDDDLVAAPDIDVDDNEHDDDESDAENEELIERRRSLARRYKIQEVIKRRQVLLVQVVKEERGNKGAALTTYLSLAGRYSVLMPNTARGGGISRKITASADRKRLKQIASELSVPAGMGVILRTAGAARTKAEIKRDFEYLSRLWENVRQLTMKSSAPSLVYEEGSLIKRIIRDLYHKDIAEVLVAGNPAYREAKDFMRLIMPSHAKNVKAYKEDQNLFSKFNVESQLDLMFSPKVVLPSGGYLVINPTEALISIDVNSGRATREHNIEDTALQTNLEAADEVARQLRLRDLAGLIVIDFIDMTERRSIRAVEKRMKDALKNDRARIQVGRISHFGLLEMSRQRMRSGVLESTTQACAVCEGTGIVRAVQSLALTVVRAIEDYVAKRPGNSIQVRTPPEVALYILNAKRALLVELETRNRLTISIVADAKLTNAQFTIERGEERVVHDSAARPAIGVSSAQIDEVEETAQSESESENKPQRNRRRRKSASSQSQNGQNQNNDALAPTSETVAKNEDQSAQEGEETHPDAQGDDQPRKRRRRGRRGGRRNRRNQNQDSQDLNNAGQNNNEEHGATPEQTSSHGQDLEAPESVAQAAEPVGKDTTDNSDGTSASEAAGNQPASDELTQSQPEKPAKNPPRRRARRSKKSPAEAKTGTLEAKTGTKDYSGGKDTPSSAPAADIVADATPPEPQVKPATPVVPVKASAATSEGSSSAPQEENDAGQPASPARKLPQEGVIVSTSSGEAKPKRKGWWSRG